MEWIIVSIYTTGRGVDFVCNALSDIGTDGFEIEDEAEFLNFLEENRKYWDYVDDELLKEKHKETRVKVYLKNDFSLSENLMNIKNALENLKKRDEDNSWGRLTFETDGINEEDWANNWKKFFHPIKIGKKILIEPEWEHSNEETDRIVFSVNPGMTFGTGSHYTTKLCIEFLEDSVNEKTSLLDLGCGSGILSIIGLLLGAADAVAVDIDPASEHVAAENAERNGADLSKYKIYIGDVISDGELFKKISGRKYDCIVANIVADVIIALLPKVKQLIAPGGIFICSGIIDDRLNDVKAALLKENITADTIREDGGWAAVKCIF